jgi:hypothetical protein
MTTTIFKLKIRVFPSILHQNQWQVAFLASTPSEAQEPASETNDKYRFQLKNALAPRPTHTKTTVKYGQLKNLL